MILNNKGNRYAIVNIKKRIREVYIKGNSKYAYATYRIITGVSVQGSLFVQISLSNNNIISKVYVWRFTCCGKGIYYAISFKVKECFYIEETSCYSQQISCGKITPSNLLRLQIIKQTYKISILTEVKDYGKSRHTN